MMNRAALMILGVIVLEVAILPTAVSAQTAERDLRLAASATVDPKVLPLGDGRYSDVPKVGYLYPCLPKVFYSITQTGARGGGN